MSIKNATSKVLASWLTNNKCTRVELQSFARSLGVPVSGTKPELVKALNDAVDAAALQYASGGSSLKKGTSRGISVVSIDMGIRNLAFAHLTSTFGANDDTGDGISVALKPKLQTWQRISVGRENLTASIVENSKQVKGSAGPETSEDEEIKQVTKESFEPIDLAAHAYTCIKYIVGLQPTPTHILIERQRFRTGGHASVQEWSLRVGVFEGMLYSALRTLTNEGLFPGIVHPVSPLHVNRFWLGGSDIRRTKRSVKNLETVTVEKITGKEAKRAKIGIVANILQQNDRSHMLDLQVCESAQGMVDQFLSVYSKPMMASKSASKLIAIKKLDDLADSLLQGLAWLKWQENRLKYVVHDDTKVK